MTAKAQSTPPGRAPDATVRSTPENVSWGYIAADRPPVLRMRSGETVRIDTVSNQGINTRVDPVAYFGAAGIRPEQVLQDAKDIFERVRRPEGAGSHVITGPIHIEGAQPGDMLEVRVLDIEFRVPYGVNSTGPGWGVLPELLAQPAPKIIPLDLERQVALFADGVEVPLAPFMGIIAVAPPPDLVRVSTKPPGAFGGNMDFRYLTAGATLYLPVFNAGALLYAGDGHGTQGDGEVDGSALEISLAPTLQPIVHQSAGAGMKWPRAEDATHYYTMGMDPDLGAALKNAVQETVDFLQRHAGLTAAEAYSLASLSVDFRVGEAVNIVKMVYGRIPKRLFRQNAEYWRASLEPVTKSGNISRR
ncbi:MAG: acetamidase [Betaproteobacteria bacterium]|nr:acetamidase [Betaproteobacteria bacterium]